MFSASPGVPFLRSSIDKALADALRLFVPEQTARHISWHSYRVRLACKLKACGCDNPTIQAMVRWNTDRAVSIYGRFEREEYWKLLERAKAVDATSVQFTALPEIDEAQRLLEHLGLSNKTWPEITTQLMKLVPSIAEDISAAPRQSAVSTVASGTAVYQSVPVPSSTPSNTATRRPHIA